MFRAKNKYILLWTFYLKKTKDCYALHAITRLSLHLLVNETHCVLVLYALTFASEKVALTKSLQSAIKVYSVMNCTVLLQIQTSSASLLYE